MDRAPVHAFCRVPNPETLLDSSRSCEPLSARLVQARRRVFTVISNFRQALTRPDGTGEAIYMLRVLMVSLAGYFGELDEALQDECYANSSPRRRAQKRILVEIKGLVDRSAESSDNVSQEELTHSVDAFLMHETTLRARAHHEMHESISLTYAQLY